MQDYVCGPVHEVVGAEVGVATDYYLSVFPLITELGYQSLEQSRDVIALFSPTRPEDGKDEFSAAALEQFGKVWQSAKDEVNLLMK